MIDSLPVRCASRPPSSALFWPRAEFARSVVRWPVLTRAYGSSWDEHRDKAERGLQVGSRSGLSGLAVLAGRVDDLARYAGQVGGDAADADTREGYAQRLPDTPWPPGRNEACWCGSGTKYKKCCLARSRA